jgi:hypothetical protein
VTQKRLDEYFETLQAELADQRIIHIDEAKRFAIDRFAARARKRARYTNPSLRLNAIEAFKATNNIVRDFKVTTDAQVLADARHFITVVLERFTSTFDDLAIQSPLEMSYIFDNWRFGPGSSHDVKGTHTADKIQQPMTCNVYSEPLVERLRRLNPYLSRFDYDNKIKGSRVIRGSKLDFVPKNEDTVRTIAIEPSGQMALQLAAGRYLEGALSYIGLNISTQQPKNKALAQYGSISNSLATIDMKSASDMISIDLVRRLMPDKWVELLLTLRSREILLPSGEWLEMHMISTMGNGFTFPLMTLIICALIYGYRCQHGGPSLYLDWSKTCVFGDDVIVPRDEYLGVCEVLTTAGFVINTDKSYCDGPFRESCGGDYYYGVDVTPFYVKTLHTAPNVYVAINGILAWSRKTGVFLHRTIMLLLTFIHGKALLVPEWLNPDQGIRTLWVPKRYKYLSLNQEYSELPQGNPFTMMLAIGGYITSDGTHHVYLPRPRRVRYVVRSARLPNGYLDGWDPREGPREDSEQVALYLRVLLA